MNHVEQEESEEEDDAKFAELDTDQVGRAEKRREEEREEKRREEEFGPDSQSDLRARHFL